MIVGGVVVHGCFFCFFFFSSLFFINALVGEVLAGEVFISFCSSKQRLLGGNGGQNEVGREAVRLRGDTEEGASRTVWC